MRIRRLVLVALLLTLGARCASAAVTFDNVCSTSTTGTSATCGPFTLSASATAIACGIATHDASTTITSVTMNSGAYSLAAVTNTDSTGTGSIRTIIYANGAPPTGSQSVALSLTSSAATVIGCVSVTGSDSSGTPMNNGTQKHGFGGTGTTVDLTVTSATGELAMDVGAIKQAISNYNQTQEWNLQAAASDTNGVGGVATTGGSNTTFHWTAPVDGDYGHSGANFKAAGAGCVPTLTLLGVGRCG